MVCHAECIGGQRETGMIRPMDSTSAALQDEGPQTMKTLAVLSLATLIVAGAGSGATAIAQSLPVERGETVTMIEGDVAPAWDYCHGQTAGTAHRLCGTATGGPSGSLF
jgi:hypothetical protein